MDARSTKTWIIITFFSYCAGIKWVKVSSPKGKFQTKHCSCTCDRRGEFKMGSGTKKNNVKCYSGMQSLSLGLRIFLMCTKLEYPVSNKIRLRSRSMFPFHPEDALCSKPCQALSFPNQILYNLQISYCNLIACSNKAKRNLKTQKYRPLH